MPMYYTYTYVIYNQSNKSNMMSSSFRLFVIFVAMLLGMYYCTAPIRDPNQDPTHIYENMGNNGNIGNIGNNTVEGFQQTSLSTNKNCPNLLVQKDNQILLMNTKREEVPGVNPIVFSSLEEYIEFTKWQRSQNIECPVLFLQKTHDTQGNLTYKARPNITDPQGGLPPTTDLGGVNSTTYFKNGGGSVTGDVALNTGPQDTLLVDSGRSDLPFNENSMPGFDTSDFYQGKNTPMDNMSKA